MMGILDAGVQMLGPLLPANAPDHSESLAAKDREIARLREALERALPLVGLVTVRQVIQAGDEEIRAAGLNPWCINEGLATGDEFVSTDFIRYALAQDGRE